MLKSQLYESFTFIVHVFIGLKTSISMQIPRKSTHENKSVQHTHLMKMKWMAYKIKIRVCFKIFKIIKLFFHVILYFTMEKKINIINKFSRVLKHTLSSAIVFFFLLYTTIIY